MLKKNMPLFIFLFIILLMAITNPNKDTYTNWVKEQYISQNQNVNAKSLVALVGKEIINTSTKSSDFVVFSYYQTQVDGKDIKAIGVLKNFIPLGMDKDTTRSILIIISGCLACVAILLLVIKLKDEDSDKLKESKAE